MLRLYHVHNKNCEREEISCENKVAKIFSDIFLAVNTDLSGTFAVFQQVFEGDACSFRVS